MSVINLFYTQHSEIFKTCAKVLVLCATPKFQIIFKFIRLSFQFIVSYFGKYCKLSRIFLGKMKPQFRYQVCSDNSKLRGHKLEAFTVLFRIEYKFITFTNLCIVSENGLTYCGGKKKGVRK